MTRTGGFGADDAFARFLEAMNARGEVAIADPELAAEQFAAMCKGMGDIELRFGKPLDERRTRERIEGAVEVFYRAYATEHGATR